ncbi:hypothetical protein C475_03254 [Halosimplex carlsbadense 2-9-1]|uniref:Uncharacterized protein n=1 Tax=Halosimplex carlsbadense 2-9-1 TaxID=797114 RepID=M0D114_9EURY|nr:hypothetical protein [Halosimplex carlsbadense]ELZ29201.1 hypothetical protein C475_03254 [Halosimplex carlsbadense 2-9-1]
MNRDNHGVGVGDRGQSVFDFSIGVSLFLVVVLGTLVFVPTAFGSLSDDSGTDSEDSLATERVADYLVETALSGSGDSSELDQRCTLAYFRDQGECGFGADNGFAVDSGRAPYQPLNVTFEADVNGDGTRERRCLDTSGNGALVGVGDGSCDTPLTAGSSAVRNQNYVTATRLVRFEGEDVFVVVRTW